MSRRDTVAGVRARATGGAAFAGTLAAGLALAACSAPPPPDHPAPVHLPPPPPAEEIAEADPYPPAGYVPLDGRPADGPPDRPLAFASERPVTFTAQDADVRSLLTLLAEEAGVDLVLGPEVRGRVSIAFRDVPARLALLAVLEEAGLEVYAPMRAPYGPVVFYPVPVNVNRASAETIERRFGVSETMAQWIIKARLPPPE